MGAEVRDKPAGGQYRLQIIVRLYATRCNVSASIFNYF